MKLARIVPLLAIVAVCSWSTQAFAQIKIATVNAAKVFNEIQETKDLKSKMENDQKTLQQQDLERKTKIKDLQSARDALKPDAPQYADANKAYVQAVIDYRVWGEMQGNEIQRVQKQQMLTIFNKITTTVGEVATQKSLDLVLAEQKPEVPDNIDQLNVDQVRAMINQRNVLYSTPAVDISNDVIAAMDAKYKAGK
jgi:Skp family chaperone for outer membrane proteins